jgi:hypothetical protein
MSHMQQQVLDATLAADAALERVGRYVDREDRLTGGDLPALLIDEAEIGERSQPASIHSLDERELFVDVRCMLKLTEGHAAAARELGLKVEKAIAGNQTLRRTVKTVRLVSSVLERSTEGEFTFAARVQRWRFTYFVHPSAPDVAR